MSEQNKNDQDQPLTKGEFQEHLETLVKVVATKEDLKQFATKEDLKKLDAIFTTKEDLRELRDELTENISNFKNEILTSNDKIGKKLDIIITELPALNEKQRDHSDRIGTLETKTRHIQARLGI